MYRFACVYACACMQGAMHLCRNMCDILMQVKAEKEADDAAVHGAGGSVG